MSFEGYVLIVDKDLFEEIKNYSKVFEFFFDEDGNEYFIAYGARCYCGELA
jgi:hypothetical protein